MAGSTSSDSSRVRRRGTRWRWVLAFALLLSAAWFGRFAYLRIARRPTPRVEYWEERLAALCEVPPNAIPSARIPDLLRQLSWLGAGKPFATFLDPGRVLFGHWDSERDDITEVSALFRSSAFDQAYDAVQRAARAGWIDHANLDPGGWSYWTSSYDRCGRVIAAHARWVRHERSDMAASLGDWLTCIRLARQVERLPLADNQLVATRVLRWVAIDMLCAANEPHPRIDSRAFASDVLEVLGPFREPAEAFEGERIRLHSNLEQVFVRDRGRWMDVSELVRHHKSGRRTTRGVSRLWNLASPLYHDLPTVRRNVDARFDRLRQYTDLSSFGEDAPQQTAGNYQNSLGVLDGFLEFRYASNMAHTILRMFEHRMQIEAALTMLALYEYHRERSAYPRSLGDLVPDYLPRLPIDYADRKTLRYRPSGDGYVLYSIGPDREDDGGVGSVVVQYSARNSLDLVYSNATRDGSAW